jgi:hypothetical protein
MNFDFRLFSFIIEGSFQKASFKKKVVLLRDYEEHIFDTVNWREMTRLLGNEIHIFFVRYNAAETFFVLQDEWDR